jgi:predicted DNA-binding protein
VDIGKKMEEKRKYEVRVRLTKEEMERIEKVANKLGIPKARLIRNLTLAGLEDAELLEKLGFFEAIKLIEKIREKAIGTKNIINSIN